MWHFQQINIYTKFCYDNSTGGKDNKQRMWIKGVFFSLINFYKKFWDSIELFRYLYEEDMTLNMNFK